MKILNENVSKNIMKNLKEDTKVNSYGKKKKLKEKLYYDFTNEEDFSSLYKDGTFDTLEDTYVYDEMEVEAIVTLFFNEDAEEEGVSEEDFISNEASKYNVQILKHSKNSDGSWNLLLEGKLQNVIKFCTRGKVWYERDFTRKGLDDEFGLLLRPAEISFNSEEVDNMNMNEMINKCAKLYSETRITYQDLLDQLESYGCLDADSFRAMLKDVINNLDKNFI